MWNQDRRIRRTKLEPVREFAAPDVREIVPAELVEQALAR